MVKGYYIEGDRLGIGSRSGFSVSEELANYLVIVGQIVLCKMCSDKVLNVYHPEVPMTTLNDIIRQWIVNKYWHKEVPNV